MSGKKRAGPPKLVRLREEVRELREQARALNIIIDGWPEGELQAGDYEKARALVSAVRVEMAAYLQNRRIMRVATLTLLLLTG